MRIRVSIEYSDEFGQEFSSHNEVDYTGNDVCVPFEIIESFENAFSGLGFEPTIIDDFYNEFNDDEICPCGCDGEPEISIKNPNEEFNGAEK